MKNGETIEKSPRDVLDYTFKWKAWLDKASDTVSSSTITVDSGITVDSDSNNTDSATVWLSGGTNGDSYKITNQIVTAGGRTKEGHFFVKVVDPEVQQARGYNAL